MYHPFSVGNKRYPAVPAVLCSGFYELEVNRQAHNEFAGACVKGGNTEMLMGYVRFSQVLSPDFSLCLSAVAVCLWFFSCDLHSARP